jgi:hypothetical protein
MNVTRRSALLSSLFGAGYVGLRALATGLPASLLVNPRKAFATPGAMCPSATQPQFIILNTSYLGDPINANCPGTYDDPNIVHPPGWQTGTPLTLGTQSTSAAPPWATGGQPQASSVWSSVLARTQFWHVMTNTPVHPKEPDVLELMGATSTQANEMFPSLLAKALAPCLGTVQTQPLSLGASNPAETLVFGGSPLPTIPPTALRATLSGSTGPLGQLQQLRDSTMNDIYALYKTSATPAQKQFIDSLVTSQQQVQGIKTGLLQTLMSIKDDSADSQALAAVTLIQMKVSPVIAIHIPFGGDNHRDIGLATEMSQTTSGIQTLYNLMSKLQSNQIADQVTFLSLNVFGRTLGPSNTDGRQHNPNHQVSIAIGGPLKGGVFGGLAAVQNDYGCTAMSSSTGAGGPSGDITASDTLAAFAMTMFAAVGADPTVITSQGQTAKVVKGALAG